MRRNSLLALMTAGGLLLVGPLANAEKYLVQFKDTSRSLFSYPLKNQKKFSLELDKINQKKPLFKEHNVKVVDKSELYKYQNDPNVKWIRKSGKLSLRSANYAYSPDDELYYNQWSMGSQGVLSEIQADKVWSHTTGDKNILGDDIVVAVIDFGFDLRHEDLIDNVWINENEIPDNGLDDDGNGFIDDINGWNASSESGQIPIEFHGTHVAGIIAAKGNNSKGVAGVNWNVKFMVISIHDLDEASLIEAYAYIHKQKKMWLESGGKYGANVVAVNSSFGMSKKKCDDEEYKIWNKMFNVLGRLGILSVVSAPNEYVDVDKEGDLPTTCSSPYIVTVSNVDQNGELYLSGYSRKSVDLVAPGVEILSTAPQNSYLYNTGTSMSAPHVTGVISLMHSIANNDFAQIIREDPAKGARIMKKILLDSTKKEESLTSMVRSGGILSAFDAASNAFHLPINYFQ